MNLIDKILNEAKSLSVTGYHGTDKTFKHFDRKHLGSANGQTPSNMVGFFFSDSKEVATTFGKNVKKYLLQLNNPLVIDARGKDYSQYKHKLNDIVSSLDTNKYDSIVIKNYVDGGIHGDPLKSTQYIVFNTNQIKIAK